MVQYVISHADERIRPMASAQSPVLEQPDEILQAIARLSNPELESVVQRALEIRAERSVPHLSVRESELFAQINEGASEATWNRYRELRAKRDGAPLTPAEHEELLELYDTIELQHARRLRAVIELAQLRNEPVEELMDSLGLNSPGCE